MTWVRNLHHKLAVALLRVLNGEYILGIVLIGASLLGVSLVLIGMCFLVKMLLGRRC